MKIQWGIIFRIPVFRFQRERKKIAIKNQAWLIAILPRKKFHKQVTPHSLQSNHFSSPASLNSKKQDTSAIKKVNAHEPR